MLARFAGFRQKRSWDTVRNTMWLFCRLGCRESSPHTASRSSLRTNRGSRISNPSTATLTWPLPLRISHLPVTDWARLGSRCRREVSNLRKSQPPRLAPRPHGYQSRIVTAVVYDNPSNEWAPISYGWQGGHDYVLRIAAGDLYRPVAPAIVHLTRLHSLIFSVAARVRVHTG